VTTYQDVIAANQAALAFAFVEAAGDFAPYIGAGHFVVTPVVTHQVAGPAGTDFGVNVLVGGKITYTFAATFFPPITTEVWVKLSSITPAANLRIFSTGNDSANGVELYLNPTSHLHLTAPGAYDVDTGIVWPDTNWHLLQLASGISAGLETVALDGIIHYNHNPGTANAPVPNVLTLGGSSITAETQATEFAWPAVYLYAMTPANMAATFAALSNPAAALAGTVTGGAATPASSLAILNQILAAVRKVY
jgi:hypothetical protein